MKKLVVILLFPFLLLPVLCKAKYPVLYNFTDANKNGAIAKYNLINCTLSATANAVSNVSCYGQSNGSAIANPSGGTSPYTYLWSDANSQTSQTATGLSAGSYTAQVTDSNGCFATASVNITQPNMLTVAATQTNVSCYGNSNGSATVLIDSIVSFSYQSTIQSWVVPPGVTSATLIAAGATGGNSYYYHNAGGAGATITGICAVVPTHTLSIATGDSGSSWDYSGGGGGATYCWDASSTSLPLIVGAGGGGAGNTYSGANAGTNIIGTATQGTGIFNGNGGTGGHGGTGGTYNDGSGAGGAGWLSNGMTPYGAGQGYGGHDRANGFTGGIGFDYSNGGYGGGGGGGSDGGGAGGGYNGGGGGGGGGSGGSGGGGGSYLNGTPIDTQTANNHGQGTLRIQYGTLGGTAPYTYLWSTGATTSSVSNLTAGTYTLIVTDSNGCTASVTVTITQPLLLRDSITSVINSTCNGGSATVGVTGGTAPYTYLWTPGGATTATASNLNPGTYTVLVTDLNGCTASATATITSPPILQDSIKKVEVTCQGDHDGKTKIFPYGGTSPYTYLWNNSDTREGMSGLSAGTYTCTVTDMNGCMVTSSVHITSPLALSLTLSSSAEKCFGGNTATASRSTLTGGTSPYTYSWTPSGATTAALTGASAGTYTLTVTDSHGCTVAASVSVTQPTQIRDSITAIGCGTATVGVRGGTPGYNFRWTPYGGFTATATVTTIGIYTVTITDRNGCTASTTANITCPIIKHDGDDKPTGMGDTTVCCDESVVLFPNPNRGNFTIELVGAQNFVPANLEIYDVLGQKVYSHPPAGGSQFLINLSQPSGIYFYRVIAGDGNLLGEGKIVIEK